MKDLVARLHWLADRHETADAELMRNAAREIIFLRRQLHLAKMLDEIMQEMQGAEIPTLRDIVKS